MQAVVAVMFVLLGAALGGWIAWLIVRAKAEAARQGASREEIQVRSQAIEKAAYLEATVKRMAGTEAANTTEIESLRGRLLDESLRRAEAEGRAEDRSRIQDALDESLKRCADLGDAIGQLEQAVAGLQAEKQAQAKVMADLQTRLEEAKTRHQSLEDELKALNARHGEAECRVTALQAEKQALMDAAAGLEQQLAETKAQASALAVSLESLGLERQTLSTRVAELETESQAREKAFNEARERLQESFQAHAAQALQANNEAFLQLARTSLQQAQTEAQGDLAARQTAIETLLEPLKQGLQAMDLQVRSFQEARAGSDAQVAAQIQALGESQQRLQGETGRLANALRKPQVRGRWGELQLQNLVELAGMTEHVDFSMQVTLQGEEGRIRPDMLVKLPGGKCVAVDAKTPLNAYLEALEAPTEEEREARLSRLPDAIRAHVAKLADKRYFEDMAESPDFVVLFLHGEAPFALACEKDPKLLEEAMRQGVLLATPVTLMALLKSAAYGWQQRRIQDNAEDIRATAAELIKRLSTMAEHIKSMGDGLGKAVKSYNSFAGSLEGRIYPQARRIQDLGVTAYKKKGELIEFETLPSLGEEPRTVDPTPLLALAASPACPIEP